LSSLIFDKQAKFNIQEKAMVWFSPEKKIKKEIEGNKNIYSFRNDVNNTFVIYCKIDLMSLLSFYNNKEDDWNIVKNEIKYILQILKNEENKQIEKQNIEKLVLLTENVTDGNITDEEVNNET
jgi:hypothetical protein